MQLSRHGLLIFVFVVFVGQSVGVLEFFFPYCLHERVVGLNKDLFRASFYREHCYIRAAQGTVVAAFCRFIYTAVAVGLLMLKNKSFMIQSL